METKSKLITITFEHLGNGRRIAYDDLQNFALPSQGDMIFLYPPNGTSLIGRVHSITHSIHWDAEVPTQEIKIFIGTGDAR